MGRLAAGRVTQALRLEDATGRSRNGGIAKDEHRGAGGRGPAGISAAPALYRSD